MRERTSNAGVLPALLHRAVSDFWAVAPEVVVAYGIALVVYSTPISQSGGTL
jgi:hypothetical protein